MSCKLKKAVFTVKVANGSTATQQALPQKGETSQHSPALTTTQTSVNLKAPYLRLEDATQGALRDKNSQL